MGYPTLQEVMMERFSYTIVDINKAKYVIQGFIGTVVDIGGCIMGKKQRRTRK